ncbi:hypothetical protein L915_12016 [Phytophthora nicotianae]|uniref:Uncharacterized protein n=1 Tax=Phytophthora nicotianae TaxID=4792 RepID=W2GI03_PHYNI|nr:hypothetical protein L915_12016 [Phytophthora nicotianae]
MVQAVPMQADPWLKASWHPIAIDSLVRGTAVNQSGQCSSAAILAPSCAWRAIAKTGVGSASWAVGTKTPQRRRKEA